MTTKIRLILDFSIQFILLSLLFMRCILYPETLWEQLGFFALGLATWQILHSLYVVRKYQDWQRNRYLTNMRQVLAYTLLTLGIGVFMALISFGFLFPFLIFTLEVLYLVICSVVLGLALHYFWISMRTLYHYYYKPRSFWDI